MKQTETPIAEWVARHSQTKLARLVKKSQGGIRKMVLSGRNIFVVEDETGVTLRETKTLASSAARESVE